MEWWLRGLTWEIGGGFKVEGGISAGGGERDTLSWHGNGLGTERQGIWTEILGKLREGEPMRPLLPLLACASR